MKNMQYVFIENYKHYWKRLGQESYNNSHWSEDSTLLINSP